MTLKIKQIKTNLIGTVLPSTDNSFNGRYCEQFLIAEGWNIDCNGKGADVNTGGLLLEFKLKDMDSVSAFTIGKISRNNIKKTSYNKSHIKEKLQQVCIIEHRDKIVISVHVYDFTDPYIQDLFSDAYENARELINNGHVSTYIPGNLFAYFESTNVNPDSFAFRIRKDTMDTLKGLARSSANFNRHFEFQD
jgi:hypothetical protein